MNLQHFCYLLLVHREKTWKNTAKPSLPTVPKTKPRHTNGAPSEIGAWHLFGVNSHRPAETRVESFCRCDSNSWKYITCSCASGSLTICHIQIHHAHAKQLLDDCLALTIQQAPLHSQENSGCMSNRPAWLSPNRTASSLNSVRRINAQELSSEYHLHVSIYFYDFRVVPFLQNSDNSWVNDTPPGLGSGKLIVTRTLLVANCYA